MAGLSDLSNLFSDFQSGYKSATENLPDPNLYHLQQIAIKRPDLYGQLYQTALGTQQNQQQIHLKQAELQRQRDREEATRSALEQIGQTMQGGQMGPPTQQQQYKSALMQLGMANPEYAGAAIQSLDPRQSALEELDMQMKRAQLANAQAETKSKEASAVRMAMLQDAIMNRSKRSAPAAVMPTVDASAPLSVRNNNPGNMRNPQTGDFQQFATPQEGQAAMQSDLLAKVSGQSPIMTQRYGQGYVPTIRNVISTWAPPSENDTEGYINFVAQKTGIDPDAPLATSDVDRIIPAMTEMEGGQAATQAFSQPTPQEAPVAATDDIRDMLALNAITGEPAAVTALAKYDQDQLQKPIEIKQKLTEGEKALRQEFEGLPDVKEFRSVEATYQRIQQAAKDQSGANDIALVFSYMKMLDPGSTVREGEFATAQNSGGVPAYIQNAYNKTLNGQFLTPQQRQDFKKQAKRQYQGAEELFKQRTDQYKGLAKEYGYKPERIAQGPRVKLPEPNKADGVKIKFLGFE